MKMRSIVFSIFISVYILTIAFIPANNAIQLDGVISDNEWKDAKEYNLSGGGKLLMKKENKDLYVAMAGNKKAWAHVYLHQTDTIHVIHASAALGVAKYIKQNNWWRNIQSFQWELREEIYNEELIKKQQAHYLKYGWVANNNNMGNGMTFEFRLNLSRIDDIPVSFACVLAEVPLDLHYFPRSLTDNTVLPQLVQGDTPDSLKFVPATWEKIK